MTDAQPLPVTGGALAGSGASRLIGPFTVTVAHLTAGLRLPMHAHESATLNFVLEGEYRECIARGSQGTHTSATLIAKPAGAVHSNHQGAASANCLVVDIPADVIVRLRERKPVLQSVVVHRATSIVDYGRRLRRELARNDDMTSLIAEGMILQLLGEMQREKSQSLSSRERWFSTVRDMLHSSTAPTTLGSLAQELGLHPVYLARVFRMRFGCSVGEYRRRLRAEKARHLLKTTHWPLSDIAMEAGYSDQSHFSRDFRHAFGDSPGAFRKRLLQRQ